MALTLLLIVTALSLALPAASAGIGVQRIAWGMGGASPNGSSDLPTISRDGNDIAFISAAANLVRDDTNGAQDVFVHDVANNRTTRISLLNAATAGKDPSEGTGSIRNPFISGDGDYVVWSWNTDPRPVGFSGFRWQIWEWYRPTGETGILTRTPTGGIGNGDSVKAVPANDGRRVAFMSEATDLTGKADPYGSDVYFYDGELPHNLMSFGANDFTGFSGGGTPFLAGNAITVGFSSERDDVVPGDDNGKGDLFVRDSSTLRVEALVLRPNGTFARDPEARVGTSWISHSGELAVFSTASSELVSNDNNQDHDVFLRDIKNDVTTLLSADAQGHQGTGPCHDPSISADGRFAVFTCYRDDLHPRDIDTSGDLYLKDIRSGALHLLRFEPYEAQARASVAFYMLDEDGSRIVFESTDNGWFEPGRGGGGDAVFVADIADVLAPRGVIQSRVDTATPGSSASVPSGQNLEEVVLARNLTLVGEGGSVIRGGQHPAVIVSRTNARLVDLKLETASPTYAPLYVRNVPLLELENVTGAVDAFGVGWARVAKNVSDPEPVFGADHITYANLVTFRATWSDGSPREGATVRLHDNGVNWYSGRTDARGEVTLPVAYSTRAVGGTSATNATIVTIDDEPTSYGAVNHLVPGMHLPTTSARPPTPSPGATPTPGTGIPGFPTPTIHSGTPGSTPASGGAKPAPGVEVAFLVAAVAALALVRAARRR